MNALEIRIKELEKEVIDLKQSDQHFRWEANKFHEEAVELKKELQDLNDRFNKELQTDIIRLQKQLEMLK